MKNNKKSLKKIVNEKFKDLLKKSIEKNNIILKKLFER